MVERVARVMRTKSLLFDNEELFERKRGFEEREQDEAFASIFEDELEKKKRRSSENDPSSRAYQLDVGRPTQSLFYQGKVDISDMKGKLPHAG